MKSGDTKALAERFERALAFGTAGIRAEIGAGPMRMNRLVVGRVAAGLAAYIAAKDTGAARMGVVIGYDGRTNSAVFATDAARILSRADISVSLLPDPLPTPVLAFAVRHRHAAHGLMVTASHNPRQYNGIKVYVRDGGQLLPPADAEIAAFIDAVDPLRLPVPARRYRPRPGCCAWPSRASRSPRASPSWNCTATTRASPTRPGPNWTGRSTSPMSRQPHAR